ncbi:T9SS type A sorting domain-containing protein, partial [Crocinitomix sp.]|nr:T9SS type A sorting domain-containing protein [Crocinitomix sp.]
GASLMNAGGAYIFERDMGGSWTQIQKLDASDRTTGDHFGTSIAIDGNYLVIGAEQEDIGAEITDPEFSNAGAAYLFFKDEAGVWEEIQKIDANDRSPDDLYGQAVGISGYRVIVGAWQQDFNADGTDEIEDAGAAYIYSSLMCSPHSYPSDITICYDETYSVSEHTYSLTGTYVDTLRSINACDSIIITNLPVIEPVLYTQAISICAGTSIDVGPHVYDTTGVYYDTLNAITGCDSIITTNLIVNPVLSFSQTIDRCYGETFSVDDSIYTTSGIYENILETIAGCDSLVTTYLSIEDENITSQDLILCDGSSVTVGETIYDITGTYFDTLSSFSSCDSIVITSLYMLPEIDASVSSDFNLLTAGDLLILSTTFQWIDCDLDLEITGATNRMFTAPYNGHFSVRITDGDCSVTSFCYAVEGLSVNEYSNSKINIFPNPTTGQFTIQLDDYNGKDIPFQIINNLGEEVYNGSLNDPITSVNLIIAEGIYYVRIWNGTQLNIQKIVIQ